MGNGQILLVISCCALAMEIVKAEEDPVNFEAGLDFIFSYY